MEVKIEDAAISLARGDITKEETEAKGGTAQSTGLAA